MKGFDLKGFHKISTDAKKTVMKHPDSDHQIIIAHSALSPKRRKELDAIPLKKFADGGDTESSFTKDASDAYQQVFGAPARPEEQSGIDFASRYNAPAADAKLHISPTERASMEAIKAKEGPVAGDNPAPQAEAAPVAAPAEIPGDAAPQDTLAQPERSPAAVPEAAAPAAQPPPESAPPPAGPEQFQQNYQKGFQEQKLENAEKYGREAAAFQQDLSSGHITPETYHDLFAKKDTLGKIGTIFGLMVSGMGSGLTGQPNALLEMMNKEIKNDLDAQTQNKTNAQNFIRLNQQQQMNEADIENKRKQGLYTDEQAKLMHAQAGIAANTLSNIQMNATALHEQARMVAKMPPGPQRAAAEQALAMMGTAVTNENAKIADIAASKQAMMSQYGGNGGGTALRIMGQDKLASDVESKTVPGFSGRAEIPIPQETRDQLKAQKQYDEKAREYVDFAKQHAKNWANLDLADRRKVANQGGAMAANLQSLYRNKIKGGVFKKGEQEFIEQIIPDQPAKWSASLNAIPKVEQTIHDNENDLKSTAGSVGLNYGGGKSSAPKEMVSKSGRPIVQKNGKWVYK